MQTIFRLATLVQKSPLAFLARPTCVHPQTSTVASPVLPYVTPLAEDGPHLLVAAKRGRDRRAAVQ